jgi:hypothetical protein
MAFEPQVKDVSGSGCAGRRATDEVRNDLAAKWSPDAEERRTREFPGHPSVTVSDSKNSRGSFACNLKAGELPWTQSDRYSPVPP